MAQTSGGTGDDKLTLVIGNKNYSSWSLRAWLALEMTGAPFEEIVIPLDREDTAAAIAAQSPSRRVPVLKHGKLAIWDSLAIAEYLAELFPERTLWPSDREARARARAVTAEMHAGFATLRKAMPMDLRARRDLPPQTPDLDGDVARICQIWQSCLESASQHGPFLFGAVSIADAFFAPVVSRFVTYRPQLPAAAERYVTAIWDWPAMRTWAAAAEQEPWHIETP